MRDRGGRRTALRATGAKRGCPVAVVGHRRSTPAPTTRSARAAPTSWRRRPGRRSRSVTLEACATGGSTADELRATPETLLRQAAVAHAAGRTQLAENLARASELARVPDDEMLEIYTALRPHRSTEDDLAALGRRAWSEAYDAHRHRRLRPRGHPRLLRARPAAGAGSWSTTRLGLGASRTARERELRRETLIAPDAALGPRRHGRPERPRADPRGGGRRRRRARRARARRLRRHRHLPRRRTASTSTPPARPALRDARARAPAGRRLGAARRARAPLARTDAGAAGPRRRPGSTPSR